MFGRSMLRSVARPLGLALVGGAGFSSFMASNSFSLCDAKQEFAKETDKSEFRKFRISDVEALTHDSKVLLVETPNQGHIDASSFVLMRVPGCVDANGKEAIRPYTPLGNVKDGRMVFAVKGYEQGTLSKCLTNLQAGDTVEMKGFLPKFAYKANNTKNLVLLAGGSGITPMIQLALQILGDPEDRTQLTLIYANHTEGDIMLAHVLPAIAQHEQLTVHHVISKPSPHWKGASGRITQEIAENLMPPASNSTYVCVCGPPGFYETVSGPKGPNYTQGEVGGILKNMGFSADQVYKL
jgi:cytochrome-b5 reductase